MSEANNELLAKINKAVAEHNAAEQAVTTAQSDLVSKSRAVGQLLLEAKKLHPRVKDFEAFLKRVRGLKLSRAYDLLRLAGGRTTDEELRKDARERKQKSRAKKKLPKPAAMPDTKPPLSVTDPMSRNLQATADVADGVAGDSCLMRVIADQRATGSADTEFTEEQHRARMAALSVPADLSFPPFLDRTTAPARTLPEPDEFMKAQAAEVSRIALNSFKVACRQHLKHLTDEDFLIASKFFDKFKLGGRLDPLVVEAA